MVDININKNQGLISAIKSKLNDEGYDTSKVSGSVWDEVMTQVKSENEENKTNGKKEIYQGGSNYKGNGHSNFVVMQGVIQFSQKLWDGICKLFKKNEITTKTVSIEKQRQEEHKKTVEKATQILKENFEKTGLGQLFKTNEDKKLFLECLENVVYDEKQSRF